MFVLSAAVASDPVPSATLWLDPSTFEKRPIATPLVDKARAAVPIATESLAPAVVQVPLTPLEPMATPFCAVTFA